MARAVGGSAGALRDALAVMRGHAAEGALIDLAFFGARERHAEMLKLVNRFRRVAAEIFDGVLIAQPVRSLHGVVHVPAPVILAHIAECGGNAALRGHSVAARGKHFGDAGGAKPVRGAFERGAKARAAGADDDDIERMIGNRISGHVISTSKGNSQDREHAGDADDPAERLVREKEQ